MSEPPYEFECLKVCLWMGFLSIGTGTSMGSSRCIFLLKIPYHPPRDDKLFVNLAERISVTKSMKPITCVYGVFLARTGDLR